MNDEQCEYLAQTIKELTSTIADSSDKIVEAIDAICPASNEGIEKRLEKLLYAIEDISCR